MLPADRFEFPMGADAERRADSIPAGGWHVGNPYGAYYFLGPGNTNPAYHTGLDISREPGGGLGQPIHAVANGEITFARHIPNSSWGNLIIQRCTLPGGAVMYVRYAHSQPMFVVEGERVIRGQVLANESNADGRFYPHLHLDFSLTSVLRDHPADWPGVDRTRVLRDYIDPLSFIRSHRMGTTVDQVKSLLQQALTLLGEVDALPPPAPPPIATRQVYVVSTDGVNIRSAPTASATKLGALKYLAQITVKAQPVGGWYQIVGSEFNNGYVSAQYVSDGG